MRLRSLLTAAAMAAGLLGGVSTQAEGRAEGHGLPSVLRVAAVNQFPEGVAWDPSRRALLVGSFVTPPMPARISTVGQDGISRTLVSDADVPGFLGIKVDAARNRIVAAYGNPRVHSSVGIAVYDLVTGTRIRLVNLTAGSSSVQLVNDLALDSAGTAYATDSHTGAIYRVDAAGRASTLITDPRLLPPASGVSGGGGIVWHPAGYLLVVNYTTGKLYRVQHGHLSEVLISEPLAGADGMALRPDGALLVATNGFGKVPGSADALHELRLTAGGRVAVQVRNLEPWPDPSPTTIAVTPFGSYVVAGRVDVFIAAGSASDFVLRRI